MDLGAALTGLVRAFAGYPRRAVLEGCPHCRPSTPVDEHDLFSLTISLGNTVGDRHDVKSLLPLLFERLVTSDDLDPDIVLGKLPQEEWRSWPENEQQAVEEYLTVVWRSVLAEFPSRLGAFRDVGAFLSAAMRIGEDVDRFLTIWDDTPGPAVDLHLAELVRDHTVRGSGAATAWLHRDATRERLLRAFERDPDAPEADALAQAHDLLP